MRASRVVVMMVMLLPAAAIGQMRFAQSEGIKAFQLTGNLRADLMAGFEWGSLDSLKGTLSQYDEQKKSPLLAGLFSAAIPGTGELYTQNYWRAGGFLAAEVALWIVYAAYTSKGNNQTDFFQNYADEHWSVVLYAQWIEKYGGQLNPDAGGFSGLVTGSGSQPPWERVDWAKLNAAEDQIAKKSGNGFTHRLPRRPEQQYYELIGKYPQFAGGWDDGNITPSDIITSNVSPRFLEYSAMRGKANDFFNIASTSASVLVANHILSALDAAWSATQFNQQLKLEAHLKPTLRPYGFVEFVPTATATLTF